MNAPAVLIVDGSRLITRDFTVGELTEEQSVALVNTGHSIIVRSLDGAVEIPYEMVHEVAGAMLSVVLP